MWQRSGSGGYQTNLRKASGMTQMELAEKMSVTDKAVSKWEHDLSCPDVNSIPKLAELFNLSMDELLQAKKKNGVTFILNQIDINSAFTMIGIGLTCAGISLLRDHVK